MLYLKLRLIMNQLNMSDVMAYVEANIELFHLKRLDRLRDLKLLETLKRKNPYLFKAKNILTVSDLIKVILDAFLSSQEETIFGDFLEGLAIFVCSKTFNGVKSNQEGLDLEFDREGVRYIVEIKSGPNWGNSSQIKRMQDNFAHAKQNFWQTYPESQIIAVNGCCYRRDDKPDKGAYLKYCGQRFWSLISGDENFYVQIIEPLGHQAKYHNEAFDEAYAQIVNKFTLEFSQEFCVDGKIDWAALVQFNSSLSK